MTNIDKIKPESIFVTLNKAKEILCAFPKEARFITRGSNQSPRLIISVNCFIDDSFDEIAAKLEELGFHKEVHYQCTPRQLIFTCNYQFKNDDFQSESEFVELLELLLTTKKKMIHRTTENLFKRMGEAVTKEKPFARVFYSRYSEAVSIVNVNGFDRIVMEPVDVVRAKTGKFIKDKNDEIYSFIKAIIASLDFNEGKFKDYRGFQGITKITTEKVDDLYCLYVHTPTGDSHYKSTDAMSVLFELTNIYQIPDGLLTSPTTVHPAGEQEHGRIED